MQIISKPIKTSTPTLSQVYSQDNHFRNSSSAISYADLESAFLANIGNWKKLRRQDNKDIYKCQECDCKLEVEKKGSTFKVKVSNQNNEAH